MHQSLAHVTLLVRDYDEALAYYTTTLGFQVLQDEPQNDSKRWVVVAPAGGAGSSLLLARAANPEQVAAVGRQTGGRVFLFLDTDDFARDYDRYRKRGVRFVESPRDEPYGKVVVFEDLYGNRWDLVQRRVSPMRFTSVVPQFTVPDLVKSAEYYRDVLGFQLAGYWSDPPVFGIVWRDDVEVFFNQATSGRARTGRAEGAYDAYFRVVGVDALAADLRSRGADILEGPEDRVYGQRELVIRDCNGLILAFGEAGAGPGGAPQ